MEDCPQLGKKVGSPQGGNNHPDLSDWSDCSLRCEHTTGCAFWHYDKNTKTCTTMTGDGVYVDDTNFVAGKQGCTLHSKYSAWVTCSYNDPKNGLTQSHKKDVSVKGVILKHLSNHSRLQLEITPSSVSCYALRDAGCTMDLPMQLCSISNVAA